MDDVLQHINPVLLGHGTAHSYNVHRSLFVSVFPVFWLEHPESDPRPVQEDELAVSNADARRYVDQGWKQWLVPDPWQQQNSRAIFVRKNLGALFHGLRYGRTKNNLYHSCIIHDWRSKNANDLLLSLLLDSLNNSYFWNFQNCHLILHRMELHTVLCRISNNKMFLMGLTGRRDLWRGNLHTSWRKLRIHQTKRKLRIARSNVCLCDVLSHRCRCQTHWCCRGVNRHVFDHMCRRYTGDVRTSRRKTNRFLEDLQLWGLNCVLQDMHMRNLYNVDTWHRWFQKSCHRSGCHVLDHTCRNRKLVHKCWCNSRGAGRSVGRISRLDLSFSFQLSEKTFGPNRVHVPKDVESDVQREEFFSQSNCIDTAERPVRGL